MKRLNSIPTVSRFGYGLSILLSFFLGTSAVAAIDPAAKISVSVKADSERSGEKLFSVAKEAVAKRTAQTSVGGAISGRELEYKKRSATHDLELVREASQEAVDSAREQALRAGIEACEAEFTNCVEETTKVSVRTQSSIALDSRAQNPNNSDVAQNLGVASTVIVRAKVDLVIRGTNATPESTTLGHSGGSLETAPMQFRDEETAIDVFSALADEKSPARPSVKVIKPAAGTLPQVTKVQRFSVVPATEAAVNAATREGESGATAKKIRASDDEDIVTTIER